MPPPQIRADGYYFDIAKRDRRRISQRCCDCQALILLVPPLLTANARANELTATAIAAARDVQQMFLPPNNQHDFCHNHHPENKRRFLKPLLSILSWKAMVVDSGQWFHAGADCGFCHFATATSPLN